ncbi:MAG TPA: hypothetical protein ENG63_04975 [Candidatus Desulfofervidus auxilii]|uniref:Uncharacterized protein n=1 Tax=Desulfofervidus auxilii TaxID=1621989 RepID=A0A7C0U2H6_DESA2|nr:hypothetical protein [Candidatus Desulfofervidus auxilii]
MKTYIELICPVCGRAAGNRILDKTYGSQAELTAKKALLSRVAKHKVDFWEYVINKHEELKNFKHYGIVRECLGGRGQGFKIIEYLTDIESKHFKKLKKAFLLALDRWLSFGFLNKKEIQKILNKY